MLVPVIVQLIVTVGALFVAVTSGQQVTCPSRCLCFKTTVRCMFLSMDRVPHVPTEPTIL
ncbi:hypothetical protein LSTR_LSTR015975 [Laodelphax striatellus]|uniref:Peroxidasin n=1 Tax=Laodelphax striatellus TaxID=195883 RepID=A0A482X775_LAOST